MSLLLFAVKATMPLFTVILSRIIMKEKQTFTVYMSLVPIILGVLIATLTEISFDMIGLVSALISTLGFSLQNIFSKKVLKDTKIHHLRLLHVLGRLAFFLFLPVWMYSDMFSVLKHPAIVRYSECQSDKTYQRASNFHSQANLDYRVISLLFMDGVLNWLQNILAFSVLSLVTPLTYAVASASKRIFVIAISLFILGNPVTWMNILGMVMACCGVLCYNRVSHAMLIRIPLQLGTRFRQNTSHVWTKLLCLLTPTLSIRNTNRCPTTSRFRMGNLTSRMVSTRIFYSTRRMLPREVAC